MVSSNCHTDFHLKGKGCYKIYESPLIFSAAKNKCEADGFRLASLHIKQNYLAVQKWFYDLSIYFSTTTNSLIKYKIIK